MNWDAAVFLWGIITIASWAAYLVMVFSSAKVHFGDAISAFLTKGSKK